MNKFFAVATCLIALNAAAEDLAVKKMPLVEGRSQAYIYLERGPTTGCPEQVPPNDTTNFWAGARLTQDGTNIKLCWYRNGSIITILQPRDGKQLRIEQSEFTYLDRPAKPSTRREVTTPTTRSSAAREGTDPARKCVIAGMFGEMATTSRNARKPATSNYSKDVPWNEISLAEQKNILIVVYDLPQLKAMSSVEVGIAIHSMCKNDPDFLRE